MLQLCCWRKRQEASLGFTALPIFWVQGIFVVPAVLKKPSQRLVRFPHCRLFAQALRSCASDSRTCSFTSSLLNNCKVLRSQYTEADHFLATDAPGICFSASGSFVSSRDNKWKWCEGAVCSADLAEALLAPNSGLEQ